jgi:hypothetical protein
MTRLLRAGLAVWAAVVLTVGCTPIPPNPPPRPSAADVCDAFCELATSLRCDGFQGSPGYDEIPGNADDVPCPRVCRDTLTRGRLYTGDRTCLDTATTCDAAESCVLDGE